MELFLQVRGQNLLDASAAALLNSIKYLANIADDMHLISPVILEPILDLKSKTLGNKKVSLNCEEVSNCFKYFSCN